MSIILDPGPHVEERVIGVMPGAGGVVAGEAAVLAPGPGERGRPWPELSGRVQGGTRALLVTFTVFTLLAVISLLVRAGHTDTLFAWTIRSRPNAAFLGAAYAAGWVMSVLAVRQRSWSQMRVPVVTVMAFTLLTLFPTVWHMHRLHLMAASGTARLAAQVWVAVYLLIPLACAAVVVRQNQQQQSQQQSQQSQQGLRRPMPGWLMILLAVQGAALAAAGAVLYAGGAMSHMMMEMPRPGWPWPVTPLTSQVIGAWLLSFGFAIAVAIRDRDLTGMLVPSVAYTAFGIFELLVLLTHRTTAGTDPRWLWIDIAVLTTLIPTGTYGATAAVGRPGCRRA